MPEQNPECPECGKVFSSEEYLDKHIEVDHGGEILEVPDESFEFKPDIEEIDRKFLIGLATGLIVVLALIAGYSYMESMDRVEITVVTCESCDYSSFRQTTDELFNTNYREVDYQSEEGQQLIEKYDLFYVPGFIFEKEVENRENFTRIRAVLVEFEDAYVLPDKGNEAAQRMSEGISLDR